MPIRRSAGCQSAKQQIPNLRDIELLVVLYGNGRARPLVLPRALFTCARHPLDDNPRTMIDPVQRWFVLFALLAVQLGATAAPVAEHVFLISIDGGAPAGIQRSAMPVLQQLVREGAVSWTAQTIRPPLTLPAHTSMLTGVPMEIHGIVFNHWSPTNPTVRVPTVFTAAKAAGLTTAMFVGKEKFRHLAQPGTVDEFYYDTEHDIVVMKSDSGDKVVKKEGNIFARQVATNAANFIIKSKPRLCFIHFTDTDTIGHEFGWGSPEQIKAFVETDVALGLIVQAIKKAGLARRSVVLISADHGGHGRGHSQGLAEDMAIPWIAWGKGVRKKFAITDPVYTCDTAATVLWLLGLNSPGEMAGRPVLSAFN